MTCKPHKRRQQQKKNENEEFFFSGTITISEVNERMMKNKNCIKYVLKAKK
jgi:hypothetical protein